MDAGPEVVALLLAAALAAGWIDAVVGGGGLVMLPAMLVAFPNAAVAPLLGTNKLSAIMGTASAAVTYFRRIRPDPRIVWTTAGLALLGAGGGAALAGSVSSDALRPTVMVALAVVLVLVVARPAMGAAADPALLTRRRIAVAVLLAGGGVGFYDGLIGPGTGTFLIMVLTAVVGLDFVHASATAKVVNTATNLGAIAVFAWNGDVLWLLGSGLAVCNVIGAQIGARMALSRGSGFVRAVLVVVVVLLLARLGWEQLS
ncbi:TSUP family transporter [Streptomonospora salina]|uniref:Probable membrane transporter protein n=1 Tax=Streptomonospora salina TaxID=104205 RepID=A0A841EEI2_9ACTN|nr:TSUP family transporter [Streptomonospora salina]MBB5999318.1 putative membrane protein YfcA [Streptomonospora salina]